ncbi:hypothetical protein THIAE_04290 [Thiomicrospira aerophila AL3]|uniref:Uncharacterized protein n=1 Tax=Thiomicrospira aerophila AL3 TaxID=717772 RepID=W0DUX0_9GAMM|nr:hypothetical protein [Thiomicrospira aerophila]AHF02227.1 hypothetical protein THIAE_04290 [Thiomicrospira aerophila AL3]
MQVLQYLVKQTIYTRPGDKVHKFNGSNHTLGTMIMKFETQEEMLYKMDNMEEFLKVIVE